MSQGITRWLQLKDVADLAGIDKSKARQVVDAAGIRRLILPGMTRPRYHEADVLAMIEASVSRPGSSSSELVSA